MARWEWVAVGYFTYLAAIAAVTPRFARARTAAIAAGAAAWTLLPLAAAWRADMADLTRALLPVPVLLAGYWLSGCFFLEPMRRLERWLLRIDDICLGGPGAMRSTPETNIWLGTYFELAYFLVYAVVPAGAIALILTGHGATIERFWSAVMLAAFASYGVLPWVQTRPPRIVDDRAAAQRGRPIAVRRLNLWVLGRGSIQANTIPSGHAATATAVALTVGEAIPEARLILLVVAGSIVVATVVGRYHFVVDSAAGVLVGVSAWAVVP
jgi:membrane-associated phospholipid phosphatase